jgi:predicted AlkP superfamily phosphohydrolase/phosphomutase
LTTLDAANPGRCAGLVAAALSLLVAGCETRTAPTPPAVDSASTIVAKAPPPVGRRAAPLVVIGADGLEALLVREMVAAGRLPAIASLLRDGSGGVLETLRPAISPPIWTSMATGVLPARHGIDGFVRRRAAADGATDDAEHGGAAPDAQSRLLTSRDRRVKAIWDIAADAGLEPCVVGWWMTWPVEELPGVVVAQTSAPPGSNEDGTRKGGLVAGTSGQVQPQALEARIFALAERAAASVSERERELYGDRAGWPESMERLVRHSRWSLAADAAYERIAIDLLQDRGRCDLLLVYFGLPDVLGHRFWRWTSPADFSSPPAAAEVARFGDVLRRAYESVDRFVAEARVAAGTDATIVLASDHGMGPFRAGAELHLDEDHSGLIRTGGHSAARDAMFVAAGRGIAKSGSRADSLPKLGSVVDVAPTLLRLLGLPRGSDMDGHAIASLFEPGSFAADPPPELATHTPAGWHAQRRFADGAVQDEAQRLEQLRALGYLD